MRSRIPRIGLRLLAPALGLLVVACGEGTPTVPQAAPSSLLSTSISVRQTGDAPVRLDASSATWKLDSAHLVVVTFTVRSAASTAVTVGARGSLYDKDGRLVGDVSGGRLDVRPGADVQLMLSGPTPLGTVTAATFEFTTVPAATPIPGGA